MFLCSLSLLILCSFYLNEMVMIRLKEEEDEMIQRIALAENEIEKIATQV